jgi:hypothetical protein
MSELLLIKLAGAFDLSLGLFHLFFYHLFSWNTALPKMDPVNRGLI